MPKTSAYHLHFPHISLDSGKQLWLLYGIRTANALLIQLVVFFVPVFIFQNQSQFGVGFFEGATSFQRGIIVVAAYFGLYRLTALLVLFPLSRFTHRFGVKTTLLFSQVCEFLYLVSMGFAQQQPILLFAAAVLLGLKVPTFWIPYNTLMSRHIFKKNVGGDISMQHVLVQLISVAAPTIGGLITVVFGYQTLFLVGIIVALCIVFFILEMQDYHPDNLPTLRELWEWLSEKQYRLFSATVMGRYIDDVTISLWPLYVFILVGSVEKVGYLHSLSIFLALLITIFTGLFIDKARSRKPFFISGSLLSGIWMLRTTIQSAVSIVAVDTLDKLVASFHWLVYESALVKRSKGGKAFSYFVYREVILCVFGVLWWIVVASYFMFSSSWAPLFFSAALGVLVTMYMREKSDGS